MFGQGFIQHIKQSERGAQSGRKEKPCREHINTNPPNIFILQIFKDHDHMNHHGRNICNL